MNGKEVKGMISCPYCGFLARIIATIDNRNVRCTCERCNKLFVYDTVAKCVVG